MQVRTVVVRMPGRVEVVVASGESRVQRALHPGLLAVQLPIVVIVLAAIDLGAAAKHVEGVDETVVALRQVMIKSRQNSLIESNTGWRCATPAVSRHGVFPPASPAHQAMGATKSAATRR